MKMKSSLYGILVLTALIALPALGADGVPKERKLRKVTGAPVYTYLDINNLSTVLRNDGTADIDNQEQNSGLVFPKGSGKTACFQSGFLWGGIIGGQARVGGSAYRVGLQPGKLLSPNVSEDPALAKNRIYRVRRDVFPGA